jgi:hypothetical protein
MPAAVPILNLRLDPDRRRDLELLAEDTGWSFNTVVVRAIKDMAALHCLHQRRAAQVGGARGELLLRVVRDFGAGCLVNQDLAWSEDPKTGQALVVATTRDTGERSLFYEDDHGRLLVARTTADGVVQHYVCREGELTLLEEHLAEGAPILN